MRPNYPPPDYRRQIAAIPLVLANSRPDLDNPAFREVLRQAIQMLKYPPAYCTDVRRSVALCIASALKPYQEEEADVDDEYRPPHTDADAPPEEEYEPGCDNGEEWP